VQDSDVAVFQQDGTTRRSIRIMLAPEHGAGYGLEMAATKEPVRLKLGKLIRCRL
jgi:hypothetical protein